MFLSKWRSWKCLNCSAFARWTWLEKGKLLDAAIFSANAPDVTVFPTLIRDIFGCLPSGYVDKTDVYRFFREAVSPHYIGDIMACFLLDEQWSVSEDLQIWDLITPNGLADLVEPGWVEFFLVDLLKRESGPVDTSRIWSFMRFFKLDLGTAIKSWLHKMAPNHLMKRAVIAVLLKESINYVDRRRKEDAVDVLAGIALELAALEDNERAFHDIFGPIIIHLHWRIPVLCRTIAKGVGCSINNFEDDINLVRPFTRWYLEYLRVRNSDEAWQPELVELFPDVWAALCTELAEDFGLWGGRYEALWYLGQTFGADGPWGAILRQGDGVELPLVTFLRSNWNLNLKRIFRTALDVFVFCHGAKDEEFRSPLWLDDCQFLEKDICRSEMWTTEAKLK